MITYAGRELSDYDVRIVRDAPSSYAARDVDTEEIPGRNGAIVYDNGAFQNVTQTYTMYIPDLNRRRTARNAAAWLLSHADTYYRLEDDYEPDVYRMARFVGPLDVAARLERYGTAQLTFDCKPQRFSAAGPEKIILYPVVGGYVNSVGTMIAGDTYDRRTGYIPIAAGETISVTINYEYAGTPGLVIAAYSEPGRSPDSLVAIQTYTPAAEGASSYDYTVPSGAAFVIVAWKALSATVVIQTPDSTANYTIDGPIIRNDYQFAAAPLVQLVQSDLPTSETFNLQGFQIGDVSVAIVLAGMLPTMWVEESVFVDCEAMSTYAHFYSDVVNLNPRTTIYDTELQREADAYPVLAPGENVINTAGYIMGMIHECPVRQLIITPRWWTV